jgi:hypothetical protein
VQVGDLGIGQQAIPNPDCTDLTFKESFQVSSPDPKGWITGLRYNFPCIHIAVPFYAISIDVGSLVIRRTHDVDPLSRL